MSARQPQWRTVMPGLRQKLIPPGPWFQYHDSVGFEWNAYEVTVLNLPSALDGFRIVQLSDMHCQPHWQTAYDDLIDQLSANEPDLIVLTGDLVDYIKKPWKCLPTARKVLSQLRARHGVLGVLGNHDLHVSAANFNGTPLRLIDGKRAVLHHDGAPLELIGVPGPEREDCGPDFADLMPSKALGTPRIMLSHYPDHLRRLRVLKPDIFLCGHTHGGQASLPGRVPLQRHDSLPMRYFHGVHKLHGSWFVVSRGFGFSTFNFRAFCPAEVIELVLRGKDE